MWYFHAVCLFCLISYNVYTEGVAIRNTEMVNFSRNEHTLVISTDEEIENLTSTVKPPPADLLDKLHLSYFEQG